MILNIEAENATNRKFENINESPKSQNSDSNSNSYISGYSNSNSKIQAQFELLLFGSLKLEDMYALVQLRYF